MWISLGSENPDFEENCEKGTKKEKRKKVKRRKNMLSFSELPTKRLKEVKGKTFMRWHIKVSILM